MKVENANLLVVVLVSSWISCALSMPISKSRLHMTATNVKPTAWSPESWSKFPIKQPPNYPDQVEAETTF